MNGQSWSELAIAISAMQSYLGAGAKPSSGTDLVADALHHLSGDGLGVGRGNDLIKRAGEAFNAEQEAAESMRPILLAMTPPLLFRPIAPARAQLAPSTGPDKAVSEVEPTAQQGQSNRLETRSPPAGDRPTVADDQSQLRHYDGARQRRQQGSAAPMPGIQSDPTGMGPRPDNRREAEVQALRRATATATASDAELRCREVPFRVPVPKRPGRPSARREVERAYSDFLERRQEQGIATSLSTNSITKILVPWFADNKGKIGWITRAHKPSTVRKWLRDIRAPKLLEIAVRKPF